MKFRNYVPKDKELHEGKLAPPDPFLNIAPKQPNWYLRRDVQKKHDKLERRTLKAICKLMEEQEKEKQVVENGGNVIED
ncbi:hypothetical protein Peur_064653 [Populus x canadensis]